MANLLAPFPSFLPAPTPEQVRQAWAARVNYQVGSRFDAFAGKLLLTDPQKQEAATKVAGIVRRLNHEYWGIDSDTAHCVIEGSWGKGTQARPPRDIDILFQLPYGVYARFELRQGNKQSQLLQEVKDKVALEHPNTRMRGDGQVVMVDFANGHGVEVVPAVLLTTGKYWICNTRGDGSYKVIDPTAEIAAIQTSDQASFWTTREFVRMMKRWQSYCNVGDYLKSFQIELIAIEFLKHVKYGLATRGLYDWLMRDFFAYVASLKDGAVFVPGTNEKVFIGSQWLSRAESARDRAAKASQYEEAELHGLAAAEWQNIFGPDI